MTEKVDVFAKARLARRQTRDAVRSMADLGRTLALAGIGAAALAKDETQSMARRLVERGTLVRQEALKLTDDLATRAQVQGEHAQGRVERQVEGILTRMNIPTHDDLASVNAKLALLSAKIDVILAKNEADDTSAGIDPASMI